MLILNTISPKSLTHPIIYISFFLDTYLHNKSRLTFRLEKKCVLGKVLSVYKNGSFCLFSKDRIPLFSAIVSSVLSLFPFTPSNKSNTSSLYISIMLNDTCQLYIYIQSDISILATNYFCGKSKNNTEY